MSGTTTPASGGLVISGYNPVGLTPESFKNMQLDAGAFFVGLDTSEIKINPLTGRVGMYAHEFAEILQKGVADGKAMGATTGGGSFQAVPEVRQIEADGMRSPIIGSTVFDSWEVKLTTTLKEITQDNLAYALATSETDPESGAIIINNTLLPDHYIPTMGWAGRILDGRLMYIEIQNALNIVGTNLTFTDKGEGTIAVEYRAHQADLTRMQYAPVKIFFFDRVADVAPGVTDTQRVQADRMAILTGNFEIPLTYQTDQPTKTQWVEAQVLDLVNHSTATVVHDGTNYVVTLVLNAVTDTFNLTVTEAV